MLLIALFIINLSFSFTKYQRFCFLQKFSDESAIFPTYNCADIPTEESALFSIYNRADISTEDSAIYSSTSHTDVCCDESNKTVLLTQHDSCHYIAEVGI